MFATNKDLEDYLKNNEKNIALILEYLAKNAPSFTSTPWETSSNSKAIGEILNALTQQIQATKALNEPLSRWITASLKGNEQFQSQMNLLAIAQDKTNQNVSNLTETCKMLNLAFKNQNEFNDKIKNLLEYLIPPSETEIARRNKTNKTPKLEEAIE